MHRLRQFVLIASLLANCWLGMMAVHELGHVVAGWLSGGRVTKVVLHPLAISRTDVLPNPQPLLVVWAGPIVGVGLPLLIWSLWRACRLRNEYIARFFAGFCFVTNGLYIAVGSFEGIGDAGDMLRHGSQPWQLLLFGIITVPLGFALWHRLGKNFGFGKANGLVDERVTLLSLGVLAVGSAAMILLSPRF